MKQQGVVKDEMVTLQWSGDLTVRRIAELKTQVQQALAAATHVCIELADDAECDMTLLQLLCAAHRTASRQDKALQLCGEIPPQFKMVMNLAGFSRHVGCTFDTGESCLWQEIYRQQAEPETNRVVAPN